MGPGVFWGGFHGSRSVFVAFHGSRWVFHGSRWIAMLFYGSRSVYYGFRSIFDGSRRVFMAFHGYRFFFHGVSSIFYGFLRFQVAFSWFQVDVYSFSRFHVGFSLWLTIPLGLVMMMKNCSSPSSSLVFMSCHAEPKQAPTLALVDHWIHFLFSFLSDIGRCNHCLAL